MGYLGLGRSGNGYLGKVRAERRTVSFLCEINFYRKENSAVVGRIIFVIFNKICYTGRCSVTERENLELI